MVRRNDRVPVVFDTNVLIANYLSSNPNSPNVTVFQLWRERQLQLIISTKIAQEYTSTLAEVGIDEPLIDRFSTTLEKSSVVTTVNLGKRLTDSRDPKDITCFSQRPQPAAPNTC